jgi:hypothetical protein
MHGTTIKIMKILFKIIIPPMPEPSKCIIFLRWHYRKPVWTLFYSRPVTYLAYLICPDSFTSKYNIFAVYISWGSLLCHFLQPPLTFCLLEPHMSPQHILEKPHPVFFHHCERPSFTIKWNNRRICNAIQFKPYVTVTAREGKCG